MFISPLSLSFEVHLCAVSYEAHLCVLCPTCCHTLTRADLADEDTAKPIRVSGPGEW